MSEIDDKTRDELKEAVYSVFNCQVAEIDPDWSIWIENPMTGHWLNTDECQRLIKFMAYRYVHRAPWDD